VDISPGTAFLDEALRSFRQYKDLGERAMAQITPEACFRSLDDDTNSIAVTVKHMAGNMRSRWTDFLTTDGEKPDRYRDTEFETPPQSRAELLDLWEQGWKILFGALEPLTESDMSRTVLIRTEPHSVLQAINRQIAHYSYHVGQIVFLAKHAAAQSPGNWTSLTVPRGRSQQFTADVAAGKLAQR